MTNSNQQQPHHTFDVIISGGGMVGASLAHALSGHGLQIAVIERFPVKENQSQPSYDDRAIALSYGSKRILDALGLWNGLVGDAEPIKKIHVSDQGHFGFARLDQAEEGVEALGYVITARDLGKLLLPSLTDCEDVQLFCPANLLEFNVDDNNVAVVIDLDGKQKTIHAKLLVAADGGQSSIRDQLGIEVNDVGYNQSAIISNVTAQKAHDNVAYERFTQTGPVALLPMSENRCALVYTVENDQLDEVMGLSDKAFLQQLQQRFGYRLGRFSRIGKRVAYELRFKEVAEHTRPRVALIGNAAHTVHPIAGQGFNLGIRDVAALAEVLMDAKQVDQDFGNMDVLSRYADWRSKDHRAVMFATDSMVKLFSNPLSVVKTARNMGILAADLLPGARHWISRQAMGLAGKQPKLSRGVPLE